MRWTVKERPQNGWCRWFAWRPVTINGQMVWLEVVERRFECDAYSFWYEYRTRS